MDVLQSPGLKPRQQPSSFVSFFTAAAPAFILRLPKRPICFGLAEALGQNISFLTLQAFRAPSLTYVNRALSGRPLWLLKHLKTDAIRPG
jgi:hypothetical protein